MQGRNDKETPGSDGKQLTEGMGRTNTGGNFVSYKDNRNNKGKRYEITKLVTLNIRGLVSRKNCKVQFLNDFVKEENISVLCLQETWNKQEYTTSETRINGYSEVRSVRPGKRGRGGVSVYAREGLTILDSNEHSNEECGVVHVRIKEINCANIFSLYIPQTASVKSFEEILMKMREWTEGDSGEITVMGDFNLSEMDCWGDLQIEALYKRAGGKV